MLPDKNHILMLADAFCELNQLRETALSNRIFGESKKLSLMRGTGDLTVSRYRDTMKWFSENWPDGADWPAEIPRPLAEELAA